MLDSPLAEVPLVSLADADTDPEGFAAAIELTKSGRADSTMDEFLIGINHLLEDVNKEEDNYLRHQRNLNRWTFVFFSTGTLVMIGVMVWLYHALLSYLYARDDAREQLEKTNAGLQHHIEDRTRELREMNEELQQFAYVASHDLQEPLRKIQAFGDRLASRYREALADGGRDYIDRMLASAGRMRQLIDRYLPPTPEKHALSDPRRIPPSERAAFLKDLDAL